MDKLLGEIDKYKSNIDKRWFYTSIAKRFVKIEQKSENTLEVKKAAMEIIILYAFYMDYLKETKEFAKNFIRDYYYDFQYIRTLDLIPKKFGPSVKYKNNKSMLESLFGMLPKNSQREEELRDSAYTGIAAQQKVHESDIQPEAAREYLLNAIR